MISQELKRLYLLAPSLGLSGSKETKWDSCPGPMGLHTPAVQTGWQGCPGRKTPPGGVDRSPRGCPGRGRGLGVVPLCSFCATPGHSSAWAGTGGGGEVTRSESEARLGLGSEHREGRTCPWPMGLGLWCEGRLGNWSPTQWLGGSVRCKDRATWMSFALGAHAVKTRKAMPRRPNKTQLRVQHTSWATGSKQRSQ